METMILFCVNLNRLGYFSEQKYLFGNFPACSAVQSPVFESALGRSCREKY